MRNCAINPFIPKNMSGLAVWLRPSDSKSVTFNGLNVSLLTDLSGNGRDASQPSGSNQFNYVYNAINGKSCMYSPVKTVPVMQINWVPPKGNYTVFSVIQTTDLDATGSVIHSQDATGWNDLDSVFGVSGQNIAAAPIGAVVMGTHGPSTSISNKVSTVGTSYNNGSPHVVAMRVDDVNYEIITELESQLITSTQAGYFGANGSEKLYIGGRSSIFPSFLGYYCEYFIFNRALNDDEVSLNMQYLLNEWGI